MVRPVLAVAIAAAACAPAVRRSAADDATARGPYVARSGGDAAKCRPGHLVVQNGESYAVRLVGRPATGGQARAGTAASQELGPIPPGTRDTLVDLREELRYVEALPDESHAVYPTGQKNAPPTPASRPRNVTFSCTDAS